MKIKYIYFLILLLAIVAISCTGLHKTTKIEDHKVLTKKEQKEIDKADEEEKRKIESELIELRGKGIAVEESSKEETNLGTERDKLKETEPKSDKILASSFRKVPVKVTNRELYLSEETMNKLASKGKMNKKAEENIYELLVIFNKGISKKEIEIINKKMGVKVIKHNPKLKYYRVKIPPNKTLDQMREKYKNTGKVQTAEPNYTVSTFSTKPNDVYLERQWGLEKIKAFKAWEITKGNPDVIIAILDTGIELTHPDLVNKIVKPYNAINPDLSVDDDNGHGTTIAGIIGAEANNNRGIAGIAYNCKIMPIKVLDFEGEGKYSDVADGIIYAVDNGAKVINLSLGGYGYSYILRIAVEYALDNNCIIVAYVGNDNVSDLVFPAAYNGVIGVTASDSGDAIPLYCNKGVYVDVSAPGESVYTTDLDNKYDYERGTSLASGYVSGLAGLLLSLYPNYSYEEIQQIIYNSADVIGKDSYNDEYGVGRINAYKAVIYGSMIEHRDLAISDLSVNCRDPQSGDDIIVSVTIQNRGTAEEQNILLKLYENDTVYDDKKVEEL